MISIKPFKQSKGYCGPASLKILLSHYNLNKSEKELAKLTNATREKGCLPEEIVKAAKKLGFKAQYKTNSSIKELKELIKKDIPVIVDWFSPEEEGHYSVIIGFQNKKIILADPHFGKIRKMKEQYFLFRWFDFDNYPPKNQSDLIIRGMIVINK